MPEDFSDLKPRKVRKSKQKIKQDKFDHHKKSAIKRAKREIVLDDDQNEMWYADYLDE